MAAKVKINWNQIIILVVLAVIGYSFFSGATTGAQVVTPANKWCNDLDKQDALTKGSCEDSSGKTEADTCVDYNTVNEAFCSPSNICAKKYMNCQYGFQCVDGACVKV